jgi:hypothetical protein
MFPANGAVGFIPHPSFCALRVLTANQATEDICQRYKRQQIDRLDQIRSPSVFLRISQQLN